jgi:transposase InsO family protein
LGFLISHNSIEPDQDKVQAIKDWPTPDSVTAVRSFLGLLNYYRRFISGFTEKALPLLELTKKEMEFTWNERRNRSFEILKEALISAPVLRMPDYTRRFYVWPDASNTCMGGVLTQEVLGTHSPIAYLSVKFSPAEINYSTTERELLAILICLRKWRCYIEGREITVFTDHKPLTWARGLKNPKPRQWSWIEEIEHYSPHISYVPGENQPADSLSRVTIASVPRSRAPPSTNDAFVEGRSDGQAGKEGETFLNCKNIDNTHINVDLESSSLNTIVDTDGTIYDESDWPIFCGKMLHDESLPTDLEEGVLNKISQELDHFQFKDNTLMRKIMSNNKEKLVPFVSSGYRQEKIKEYHELLGHMASDAVYKLLKDRYWWPDMSEEISVYISHCHRCLMATGGRQDAAPIHPIPPAPLPFERWGIDFLQDLPMTDKGNQNILVFIDYCTRWAVAKATPDRSSDTVLRVFIEEIVNNYGVPDSIISDRAKSFILGSFAKYLDRNNVKLLKTSSYHPRTNGMTERLNRILKGMLTKYCDGFPEKWDKFLGSALFALRVRTHTVTKFSPFFLLYGRHPRLPGDIHAPDLFNFENEEERGEFTIRELDNLGQSRAAAYKRSVAQAQKMIESQDRNEETIEDVFFPGTFVKRKNHRKGSLDYPWSGPFIVIEVLPNSLYRIMSPKGEVYQVPVHQDELRLYTGRSLSKFYYGNRTYSDEPDIDDDVIPDSGIEELDPDEESRDINHINDGGVVVPNDELGEIQVLGLDGRHGGGSDSEVGPSNWSQDQVTMSKASSYPVLKRVRFADQIGMKI